MSCKSNGCKLARPGSELSPLCFAGCRVEMREKKLPAPPPEARITDAQVTGADSTIGDL